MRRVILLAALVGVIVALSAATAYAALTRPDFADDKAYPAGPGPVGVTNGKFNGDGNNDLVTTNRFGDASNGDVSCLAGNGDGTFEAPNQQDLTVSAYAINNADFDGDGNLDVVITDPSSSPPNVVVLLGNDDCTFDVGDTEPSGGTDPFDLAVADFDKDGDPDVAVTNRMSNNVRIFDNDGTGDLSESQTLGTGSDMSPGPTPGPTPGPPPPSEPRGIAAGDFDKDRDTDLVVVLSGYGAVRLLENEGEDGFDEGPIFPVMSFDAPRPSPIAVSDFNRDGKLDFATGNLDNIPNPDPDVVAVRLGRGNGNFDGPQFYSSGGDSPLSLAVGNYNLQRGADIAAANQFTNAPPAGNFGNVGVLTNQGNGTFLFEPDVFDTGDEPNDVTAGKLNDGDKVDLATANFGDDDPDSIGTVSVLINTTRHR